MCVFSASCLFHSDGKLSLRSVVETVFFLQTLLRDFLLGKMFISGQCAFCMCLVSCFSCGVLTGAV